MNNLGTSKDATFTERNIYYFVQLMIIAFYRKNLYVDEPVAVHRFK